MPETALGRLLKELRGERGLTLREVAQLGEVDHAYVHRLETGAKEAPSDEVLTKLARALRASKRDGEMMRFLSTHPHVDPGLIEAVRMDPTVTFEEFQAATTMVSRGARPDYQTLLARIRRFIKGKAGVDELSATLKAREFIGKVGPLPLPVSVEAYAKAAGATVKLDDLEPGEAGWSFQKPDGEWCICVNRQDRPERRRFTVCHEVAHIVLGLPHEHGHGPSWSYARRPATEILCDVFASELLLPHRLFKPQVDAAELGLGAIDDLAGVFEASTMATGSRFAAFSGSLCAFVLSEQGKVRYSSRSPSLREAKAWIAPGSALPDRSLSKRLRAGDRVSGPLEVDPDVWFSDWDREGTLYEDARQLGQWDQTLALLWFDDDDLPPPRQDRGRWEDDTYGLRELDGQLPWPGRRKRK